MPGDTKAAIVVPDWAYDFISPRTGQTGSTTGLQKAHMAGDDFLAGLPDEFKTAYAELDRFGIGANYTSNFELLSETMRGGAVFQTTTHIGQHHEELNSAQYDRLGERTTMLNDIQRRIEDVLESTAPGSDARTSELRDYGDSLLDAPNCSAAWRRTSSGFRAPRSAAAPIRCHAPWGR